MKIIYFDYRSLADFNSGNHQGYEIISVETLEQGFRIWMKYT